MSFDALALAAVRDEVERVAIDGRIQRTVFPDDTALALEIYTPGRGRTAVLCSIHPEQARVHVVSHFPARGVERETPFMLAARKHLRQARIRALRQPAFERVLVWEIEQADASGAVYEVRLIVEAMGRRSNLLLVDGNGSILDAMRRTPPSRNPRRPVLPHLPYEPPPAQDRLLPHQLDRGALADAARGKGGTIASFLQSTVAGLSPEAAREIAFRATGSTTHGFDGTDWARVVTAILDLFRPLRDGAWAPSLARRDGHAVAYAAYPLEHLAAEGANLERVDSISRAIETYVEESGSPETVKRRGDPLRGERQGLLERLQGAVVGLDRRIAALEREQATTADLDRWRRIGEAMLVEQWAIRQGAAAIEVNGESVEVDRDVDPVEQAQAAFARYRKGRETAERVPALLEEARRNRQHLASLVALTAVADSPDAMKALRREAGEALGKPEPRPAPAGKKAARGRAQSAPGGAYRRVALADGWEALVGGSAEGNARVTFSLAGPEDTWLHARGVPGAHVILRGPEVDPPAAVLERAAGLAAWYSPARSAGSAEVDLTQRRYVKKIPGGAPGLVRYERERTIRVAARAPEESGRG